MLDLISDLNSDVEVLTFNFALTSKTALDVVADFDVVLDCSDNVATRYLVINFMIILGPFQNLTLICKAVGSHACAVRSIGFCSN